MPVQSTVAGSVDFGVWGQRRTGANLQTPTPELNVGFTGHVHDDELGLINMGGRMYDPALHRFMSPDPFVPTPAHGPSWNRYAYALNDPVNITDPTGYDDEPLYGGQTDVPPTRGGGCDWGFDTFGDPPEAPNYVESPNRGRAIPLWKTSNVQGSQSLQRRGVGATVSRRVLEGAIPAQ